MAGLLTNANYINDTIKPAIKSAIEAQGVTVPSTDSFLDYADRIAEIEGGGSGYQLKDLPSGAISTVTDAAPLPLNALKVSVEAWQEGSGTPSPSNIRPIHGWDSGEIIIDNGIDLLGNENNWNINASGKIVASTSYSAYVAEVEQGKFYKFTEISDLDILVYAFFENEPAINSVSYNQSRYVNEGATSLVIMAPITGYVVIRTGRTSGTNRRLCLANIYALDFPSTIYGAEWDVANGGMKQTDGYIASYNGESLPSTWISDRDVYASGTTPTIGAEVVYKLATPTTINLSPLSIRLIEGTNNLYADCGEVIEGEYFVDEGAIDVRKVDYSIGSSGSIKTTDGRVLSGFASMNGYHARPLDASGNWLDVDWSKDFEIGVAFKMTEYPSSNASQYIFGNGTNDLGYRFRTPRVYFSDYWQSLLLDMSLDGSSWYMDASVNFKPVLDTWYFIRLKFDLSTLRITLDITTDFETYTTLHTEVLSSGLYHNGSALGIGGDQPTASDSTTDSFKVDTFNTYIKGDGVDWGASTGAFPS